MNCTSVTPQSIVVCRLCTKSHAYYVNIFISNESCEIIVEEAIQDVLGLPVAVGDGLPNHVCRLCVRKLIEFREFKNMCFKSATELRAYALGNDFLVSKIKDEDAADIETSREGSIQENTFLNGMQVSEVYVTMPDELAIRNVSHAKEELWSTDNALVVKEEVYGEENHIEGNVPMNALTSFTVDPLAVDTMALIDEAQEPKVVSGKGNSLSDTSPQNHIRVTEVFVPFPDELAMGIVRYAEEDLRQTQLIVKEEMGEGLECSENDVPVVSRSNANVDPLAVDTTVHLFNNIGGLTQEPEKESDKFGVHIQGISQNQVHINPSCDPVQEENLQLKYIKPNSFVEDCFPKGTLTNQKKNIECYASSKKFSQLNDRARPVRNDEREQLCHQAENASYPTEYICNYCSTRYLEKKSLAVHIKRHMDGMRSARISLEKDFQPRFSQNLLVKTFKCNECGKMFNRSGSLTVHSRIHSGVKPFRCNDCGKMFTSKSNLNRHLVVHTGVKRFKCSECGMMFSTISSLNYHSVVHTGVKQFKCKECGKMFARSYYLKMHSVVHTGVKLFKCNECGKTFTTKSNLNMHSVVHTGVKRFKCEECGKMFARSGDLKTHSVVHTGVNLFKCNECGNMFTTRSDLNNHSVLHTGVKLFECNECGKTFTKKSNLNKHSVVHTGVKRFECKECGKMFARSGELKTHSVFHTGVKLFKCNECGKMFTTSSHLRRHSHIHSVLNPL